MSKDGKLAWGFLGMSFLSFCGLGLEVLIMFEIEPRLYGVEVNAWSESQYIMHWIFTCIVWIIVGALLLVLTKKKMKFDPLSIKSSVKLLPAILSFVLFLGMLIISYLGWNGLKILKELNNLGLARFIFQYIYYVVETLLVILIIVFAQKAGELWFKNPLIPYGGIFVALTWGLVHMLTKGDVLTGIIVAIGGLIFGSMYILMGKDLRKAFPLICLAFIL